MQMLKKFVFSISINGATALYPTTAHRTSDGLTKGGLMKKKRGPLFKFKNLVFFALNK